ncbi:MAG: hypothetical protein BGO39_34310 [Chloroflexi bacterium 54-19]|nr:MAG: hypothetical protein BGO39_34310 [Chloroflexi bacterium 54-19]
MLKLKVSGENRKSRFIIYMFIGVVCLLWAAMSAFMVYAFGYGVFYLLFIVPLLFLALSIISFWIARQIIKLPLNS